uniref:Uncharacterized protein n=1 Tax=Onchocerca volvulus TaxID=6282 RepID=A0A2K6W7U3_ONCVO
MRYAAFQRFYKIASVRCCLSILPTTNANTTQRDPITCTGSVFFSLFHRRDSM